MYGHYGALCISFIYYVSIFCDLCFNLEWPILNFLSKTIINCQEESWKLKYFMLQGCLNKGVFSIMYRYSIISTLINNLEYHLSIKKLQKNLKWIYLKIANNFFKGKLFNFYQNIKSRNRNKKKSDTLLTGFLI